MPIEWKPQAAYQNNRAEAERRIALRDPDDWPTVALALTLELTWEATDAPAALGDYAGEMPLQHLHGLRQLPRAYVPFALLTVFGPLLVMLVQGDQIRPSAGGLAFLALLLLGLARRSRLAWGLLLAWNGFLVLAVAAALGGSGVLLSAPLLLLVGLGSIGLLLSPSMRQHLGGEGRRPGTAGPRNVAG